MQNLKLIIAEVLNSQLMELQKSKRNRHKIYLIQHFQIRANPIKNIMTNQIRMLNKIIKITKKDSVSIPQKHKSMIQSYRSSQIKVTKHN